MVIDGTEYADPENGYPKYIEVESFVDHFILNEFCKNVDAYRISAYMYKDRDSRGGKLIMGPIWDFNLSLGKAWFSEDMYLTEGWQVDYNSHRPWDMGKVPFWWEKLSRDSAFVNRIEIRWRELRTSIFQKDSLYSIIDLLVDSLAEARARNFEKWPETEEEHTYEKEIQLLKQWISDRTDWINENLDKLASVQVSSKLKSIPEGLTLKQNFPNPFNPVTTIQYRLPEKVFVNITVYNALGQKISTLANETKPAGFFQVQWDASSVGSGIYFYMIQAGDFKETKKCLIIK